MASNEGSNNTAAGSAADGGAGTSGESAALFSKLRSFSIGSGPNSPQRVVSNLRGYLSHRLSNITPSDTGESWPVPESVQREIENIHIYIINDTYIQVLITYLVVALAVDESDCARLHLIP